MATRALLVLLLGSITLSAQITINGSGPGFSSIQAAINSAVDGDTIQVGPGTWVENLVIANKQLTIEGAGPNSTTIDAAQIGRCLMVDQAAGGTTTIRGFWLTQGRSPNTPFAAPHYSGGAILATASGAATPWTLRVEDCVVIAARADLGGAIFCGDQVQLELVDCNVLGNGQDMNSLAPFGAAGGGLYCIEGPWIENSWVQSNFCDGPMSLTALGPGGVGGGLYLAGNSPAMIIDSGIENNRAHEAGGIGGGLSANLEIRHSLIRKNRCNLSGSGAAIDLISFPGAGSAVTLLLEDCLVSANRGLAPGARAIHCSGLSLELLYCTVIANGEPGLPFSVLEMDDSIGAVGASIRVRNSIVAANTSSSIVVNVASQIEITNSLLSDGFLLTGTSTPNVVQNGNLQTLLPGFVDPNGDFRLLPGSPCVDAGLAVAGDPTVDLMGLPRLIGNGPDMGCFELQNQDPGPFWAGTTSTNDVFLFNGSSGGITRNLTVDAGSICTVTVNEPVPGTVAPFILWGRLGLPSPIEAFSIPFASGAMAFTPHLVDSGNPSLFTFSNNILPSGVGLVPSTPAPWSVTGSAAPFPITMTVQGLIVDGPGALRITNAIALHTR